MLGNMTEAMERSLALRVIMSIQAVSSDVAAVAALRDLDIFETLERKSYREGPRGNTTRRFSGDPVEVVKGLVPLGASNSWNHGFGRDRPV